MTTPTTITVPPPATYTLDPAASTITFTAKHMFGLGTVRGSFPLRSGELVVTDPVTGSSASAVVDVAGFTSANPKRDTQVTSAKFLDAAHHPDITFTSTGVTSTADGWTVEGRLTVKGTTGPVRLTLRSAEASGTGLALVATTTVDRTAFGITAAKGLAGRDLHLELHLTAHAG